MKLVLTPAEEELYAKCVDVYGINNQLEQFEEECAEAILAVRKYFRALKSDDLERINSALSDLFGEIVDVSNMSSQMQFSFIPKPTFERLWNMKVNRQIQRVKDRLKPATNE